MMIEGSWKRVQKLHTIRKRIIIYVIIVSLLYVLFSGIYQYSKVNAQSVETIPAIMTETDIDSNKEFQENVLYRVTITGENLDDYNIHVCVKQVTDGKEKEYILSDADQTLIFEAVENGKATTVLFTEEGIYTVYAIAKKKEQTDIITQTDEITFSINPIESVIQITDVTIDYDEPEDKDLKVIEEDNKNIYYLNAAAKVGFKVTEQNWQTAKVDIETTKEGIGRIEPMEPLSITEPKDTDNPQSEMSIVYTEEGCYKTVIQGVDAAGNVSEQHTRYFVIDWTSPVITQSMESEIVDGAYYDKPVQFTYSINESNYKSAEATIDVVRVFDGKTYHETGDMPRRLELNEENSEFQYSCDKQGAYTITIQAKDQAGNMAMQTQPDGTENQGYTIHFVINMQCPELTITGVDNQYKTKNPVLLTFQAASRNHDFASYLIQVTRSSIDGELEFYDIIGNEESVYDVNGSKWSTVGYVTDQQEIFITERILRFEREGIYKVTFSGMDKAGNVAKETEVTFYIDRTAPRISEIEYSDAGGLIHEKYHNVYSAQAVKVEFSVRDLVTGVNEGCVYVTVGTDKERAVDTLIYIARKSAENRYYVYIPTDVTMNEFDSRITIWASDALANENYMVSSNIVYNTVVPVIHMTCDTDYSVWTNQDLTFHITTTDEKSGLKEVAYKVNDKIVKRIVFDQLVYSYDYDVTATESADKITGYTVSVEVINNCGTANTLQRQVYIDKEKPEVRLSGIKNGDHYNTNQIFQTDVHDVSYTGTRTVYMISCELDGKMYTMSLEAFISEKYNDSCNRKILREGSYTIYAITTDAAGNQATSNTLRFVIDKTAPELSVSGVSDGSMNGAPVTIDFTCVESFFATNQISIQVEKTLDGVTTTEEIKKFPKNVKRTSMRHTFSEDGTYKVMISAIDKAGNIAQRESVSFSIDQTKPVIYITGTANYEQWRRPVTVRFSVKESYYLKNQVIITGTHIDINGNVTKVELPKMPCSGKINSLLQTFDKDGIYYFKVVSKDEAGNWESDEIHFTIDQTNPQINKVRSYHGGYYQEFRMADSLEEIFKDLTVVSYRILLNGIEYNGTDIVTEEGKYNLYVEVEDELGHQSSENVEFIIDHTAPKVLFTGVQDGENVHESGNVVLTLANTEDKITGVRMNGKDYGADTRILSYSKYGVYYIEVDCEDKAGNAATRKMHFVYNNPLAVAPQIAGVTISAVSVCIWFWIGVSERKRRKERHDKSSGI